MKSMNQMPSMPSLSTSEPDSMLGLTEDSAVQQGAAGSDVLSAPDHSEELKAPTIISPDDSNNSQVSAPKAPKGGIAVVATGKGFYNQERLREGDKFSIRSEEDFGQWFKCEDKFWEARRVEFFKQKKASK